MCLISLLKAKFVKKEYKVGNKDTIKPNKKQISISKKKNRFQR